MRFCAHVRGDGRTYMSHVQLGDTEKHWTSECRSLRNPIQEGFPEDLQSWRKVTTMVAFLWHFRKLGAVKMSDIFARQDPKQICFIYLISPLNLHIIVLTLPFVSWVPNLISSKCAWSLGCL